MQNISPLPEKELVSEFFKRKNTTESKISDSLGRLFSHFSDRVAAKDFTSVKGMTEARLLDKLISNTERLNKFKIQYNQPAEVNSQVVDTCFLKGLNVDRSLNDSNQDYYAVEDLENFGIKIYQHKYFNRYD